MDLLELASRNIFIPAFDVLRGISNHSLRRHLFKNQFLSSEQICNNQWQSLQTMLQYVYVHNKFYRERFLKAGITPSDIKTAADFSRLPILTKDDIRNNLDILISDGYEKKNLLWRRTGGSTGIPLQLYQDKQSQVLKEALVRRHDSWAHFQLGAKRASLWGDIKPPKGLARIIFDVLATRTVYLDTLKIDEHNMLEFVEIIKNKGIRLLFGHAHSLYFFAKFCKGRHIDLKFEGIISSAETLPLEERNIIEEIFGKRVFDRYGCEEIGIIASECEEHDGMHVAAEGVYLEIVEGNELQPGRVIVTDLVNRGTPLIRYEIGDLATTKTGSCRCGRGLPRIGRVVGRTSDILYTPEGKQISGISILDTFIIHIPGFRQVQIIQEKIDEISFNIIKDTNFSEISMKNLTDTVPRIFGPSMKFKVNFVDNIPLTGRGKFQCTICKLEKQDNP